MQNSINFNVPKHEAGLPDWLRINNPVAYYMEQGQAIINGEFEAITINEILLGMKDFVALHQPEGRVITIATDGDIITMEAIDTYAEEFIPHIDDSDWIEP